MKILILLFFLAIVFFLFSGLKFLISSDSKKTAAALTLRIVLSVILFAGLFVAFYFDLISPHLL